ncbi:Transposon Ty3-G Gag-Pol polyprotein [Dictyocoela muelleri]|nr:Transposon Ty3-G Gag-Pol polyprotein [Dictyocoela muelleri]
MPFGLANAPRTFQQIMLTILGHLIFVKVLLDDVLIHSENAQLHAQHLQSVLSILKDNGFTINKEKSTICAKEVNFLGHIISELRMKPDTRTIRKIIDIKHKNLKSIQRILGVINWYRPFVPQISQKTLFLRKKLQKEKDFSWKEEDDILLNKIVSEIEN